MTGASRDQRKPVLAVVAAVVVFVVGVLVVGGLRPSISTTRPTGCGHLDPRGLCHDRLYLAWQGLDRVLPGHPEVAAIDSHEGTRMCPSSGPCARSGGLPVVFVFRFADGTAASIVVDCPGIGPCDSAEIEQPSRTIVRR